MRAVTLNRGHKSSSIINELASIHHSSLLSLSLFFSRSFVFFFLFLEVFFLFFLITYFLPKSSLVRLFVFYFFLFCFSSRFEIRSLKSPLTHRGFRLRGVARRRRISSSKSIYIYIYIPIANIHLRPMTPPPLSAPPLSRPRLLVAIARRDVMNE